MTAEGAGQSGGGSVGSRIESILDAAERAAMGIREDAQEWARRYLEESRQRADEAAAERVKEISSLTDNLVNRARAVAQQSDELLAALDEAGRRVVESARPGSNDVSPAAQPSAPPAAAAPPAPPPAQSGPPPLPDAPPPPPARETAPPPARPAAPPPPFDAPPARAPAPPAAPGGPQRLPHRPPEAPPPAQAPPPVPQPPPPEPAAAPQQTAPPAPSVETGRVSEGARLLATQMAVAGSTRDEIAWRLREEFGIEDSAPILDEIGI